MNKRKRHRPFIIKFVYSKYRKKKKVKKRKPVHMDPYWQRMLDDMFRSW